MSGASRIAGATAPAVFLAVLALSDFGCGGRPTVVRPDMGGQAITVVPPVARHDGQAAATDLAHREQLAELLGETREPIRLRVLARPLEGDPTTDELISVCRSVLTLARGRTRFDANDPVVNERTAEEARVLGVTPLGSPPGRRRRDPLPQDAEYRALVVAIGRDHLVVSQITPDRGTMEFQVAEAISRLLHGPRLVGLVTDTERDGELVKLRRALDRLDVRHVSLDETLSPELSALIVVGPGERLGRKAVRAIEGFLEQGKSVAFLIDGMDVEEQQNRFQASPARTGLEHLLEDHGISVQQDIIFDNRCGRVSVPARVGRMMLPYPPIPTAAVEPQEITPDAREVRLPFPSSVRVQEREGVTVTPLLTSSEESWAVTERFDLSPYQQWRPTGRPGPFMYGAVVELEGGSHARIAVVGNARFVEDSYLDSADNARFVRQLVEWLGGHRALTRMIDERPEPAAEPDGVAPEQPPAEAPVAEPAAETPQGAPDAEPPTAEPDVEAPQADAGAEPPTGEPPSQ